MENKFIKNVVGGITDQVVKDVIATHVEMIEFVMGEMQAFGEKELGRDLNGDPNVTNDFDLMRMVFPKDDDTMLEHEAFVLGDKASKTILKAYVLQVGYDLEEVGKVGIGIKIYGRYAEATDDFFYSENGDEFLFSDSKKGSGD